MDKPSAGTKSESITGETLHWLPFPPSFSDSSVSSLPAVSFRENLSQYLSVPDVKGNPCDLHVEVGT